MTSSPEAYRRPHPFSILTHISRLIFLLVFPLLRGLITSLRGGFQSWLAGAWMDICVVVFIFLIGFLAWFVSGYRCTGDCLEARRGILLRRTVFIPLRNTSSAAMTRFYYLKPFRAVRIRVDTPAGSAKDADFSLILWKKDAQELFHLVERDGPGEFINREYRPKGIYIMLLSALMSNSFAGIMLFSTFISQSGNLLGQEFADRIYGTLEQITRVMAFGIPPAAAALAYIMVGGWAIAFIVNLIRHKNFRATRKKDSLFIKGGIITNRIYTLSIGEINYVDIRQTVLTRILRIYSVFVQTAGFGKAKDDVSALIPSAGAAELKHSMSLLLPEFKQSPRTLKPNLGSIFKFILDPFWFCTLIPLGAVVIGWFFPSWADFTRYMGLMASIPAWWFMAVRILDFTTSGISRQGDTFTLRYSNLFYLHTVIIQREKIASVCLRQSILQRGDGKCDVLLYSRSERPRRHHLKNLDRQGCIELFGLNLPHGDQKEGDQA